MQVFDRLYHIMLYQVHLATWMGFKLTTSMVIGTDCIGSFKSKYHTITTTTSPKIWRRTDYTLPKRKRIKRHTVIDIKLHRELKLTYDPSSAILFCNFLYIPELVYCMYQFVYLNHELSFLFKINCIFKFFYLLINLYVLKFIVKG